MIDEQLYVERNINQVGSVDNEPIIDESSFETLRSSQTSKAIVCYNRIILLKHLCRKHAYLVIEEAQVARSSKKIHIEYSLNY